MSSLTEALTFATTSQRNTLWRFATRTVHVECLIKALHGIETIGYSYMNGKSKKLVTVMYSGIPVQLYTLENCRISNHLRRGRPWEPHMHAIFQKYIKPTSVVIECGCHIGTHTVKMASMCSKLYGFEPMPTTFEVLKKNITLNNLNNVILHKKGVADKEGTTKYSWIPADNPGGSGLENNPMGKPSWIESTTENIEVELTTIDSLNLEKLDFMKVDVEGYEILVIKGAMNTIQRCRPVISMEVWKDHNNGVDLQYTKETFKDLLDLGYSVQNISGPDFLFTPK